MSSTTANSAEKVKQGEGSDSVHGFGYCFRDKRHVPAATTQPHHDSTSITTSFQRNGSKAGAILMGLVQNLARCALPAALCAGRGLL